MLLIRLSRLHKDSRTFKALSAFCTEVITNDKLLLNSDIVFDKIFLLNVPSFVTYGDKDVDYTLASFGNDTKEAVEEISLVIYRKDEFSDKAKAVLKASALEYDRTDFRLTDNVDLSGLKVSVANAVKNMLSKG